MVDRGPGQAENGCVSDLSAGNLRTGWSYMNIRRDLLFMAAATLVLCGLACPIRALDLEEVLSHMNGKVESIKDLEASAKVTKYDSVFEMTSAERMKLFFQRPYLARADTYRKEGAQEVLTTQYILGTNYILKVWPPTRTAERRLMDPKEIERMAAESNDPVSLFTRKPEVIRKDFLIEAIALPTGSPPNSFALRITPLRPDVKFEYKQVEMVIDTTTWLPRSIKAYTAGGDWSLYTFEQVKVNPGLPASTFQAPPGIDVKDVNESKGK